MRARTTELPVETGNNVLNEFARRFNINPMELISPNKKAAICELRHLYCKLRYERHGLTYEATGREINREHSTVRYAVKRINGLLHVKDRRTVALWKRAKDIPGFYM